MFLIRNYDDMTEREMGGKYANYLELYIKLWYHFPKLPSYHIRINDDALSMPNQNHPLDPLPTVISKVSLTGTSLKASGPFGHAESKNFLCFGLFHNRDQLWFNPSNSKMQKNIVVCQTADELELAYEVSKKLLFSFCVGNMNLLSMAKQYTNA